MFQRIASIVTGFPPGEVVQCLWFLQTAQCKADGVPPFQELSCLLDSILKRYLIEMEIRLRLGFFHFYHPRFEFFSRHAY